MEEKVRNIWCRVLELDHIGLDDNVFVLGCSSIKAMQICSEVEKEFNYTPRITSLLSFPTIRKFSSELEKQINGMQKSQGNLVEIKANGHGPPLILLHSVGGELFLNRRLVSYLEPEQRVYGFQAPASATEYKPIPEMIEQYADELMDRFPSGQCCLAGFSIGGYLAYELAQVLSHRGRQIDLLVIMDSELENKNSSVPGLVSAIPNFCINLPKWLHSHLRSGQFRKLVKKTNRKIQAKRNRLFTRLGITSDIYAFEWEKVPDPSRLSDQIMDHYVNVHRGMQEFVKVYDPQPYSGPIVLIRASVRALFHGHRTDLGWKPLAKGGLKIETVKGRHDNFMMDPCAKYVAEKLTHALRDVAVKAENDEQGSSG